MYAKFTGVISAYRRLWIVLLIFAALPFLIKVAWSSSSAQSPESTAQERKLKMKEGINVPLEVKARNLQSKDWLKDVEIEVKNVGKKPIYFILVYLIFPDDKRAEKVGFPMEYGNPKLVLLDRYAQAEDPHIDPGDSYVFKIEERYQKGFEGGDKDFPDADKKINLEFEIISFGDGTGLINGGSQDYRKKSSIPSLVGPQKKSPEIRVLQPQLTAHLLHGHRTDDITRKRQLRCENENTLLTLHSRSTKAFVVTRTAGPGQSVIPFLHHALAETLAWPMSISVDLAVA